MVAGFLTKLTQTHTQATNEFSLYNMVKMKNICKNPKSKCEAIDHKVYINMQDICKF